MLNLFINMNHFWIGTELLWGLVINQHVRTRCYSLPDASHNPLPPEDFPTAFAGVKKAPCPSPLPLADLLLMPSSRRLLPDSLHHTFSCPSNHIPTSIGFTLPPEVSRSFFFHTLFFLFLPSEPSNNIMSLIHWG